MYSVELKVGERDLDGDKVLLPEKVLTDIAEACMAPYIFQVRSSSGRARYVGVLEFSAFEGVVVLPKWMTKELGVNVDEVVSVEVVQGISKVEFIQFRQRGSDINGLARETLEFLLRTFTVLAKEDCVILRHGATNIVLDVVDIEPSPGCLIDADVRVEFLDAVEENKILASGDYTTGDYSFENVSAVEMIFSGKNAKVHMSDIPVVYCEDEDLKIVRQLTMPGVHHVRVDGDVHVSIGDPKGADLKEAGDGVECSNCHSMVPGSTIAMHQSRCERMNWYCLHCKKVYRKILPHTHCSTCSDACRNVDQHRSVCHEENVCVRCKQGIEWNELERHSRYECQYRLAKCAWCFADVPMLELDLHQTRCACMTEKCEYCNRLVQRQTRRIHLLVQHQIR